jgi:hypothetical protein
MDKNKKMIIAGFIVLVLIGTSYFLISKDRNFDNELRETSASSKEYKLNGALLYEKDSADSIAPIKDHYTQTLAINTNLEYIKMDSLSTEAIMDKDFIHIHNSIGEDRLNLDAIEEYLNLGGVVILNSGLNNEALNNLAGVKGYSEASLSKDNELSMKIHDDNIEGLSKLGFQFIKHNLDWGKGGISFNQIDITEADILLEISEKPMIVKKSVGKGKILVFSDLFLDYGSYITGYDFKERDEDNQYYSFFNSTFNQKTIDGILEYISLEKYGMAFLKTQGPYGRPGLAWQNHYEVSDSIKNKEAIVWGEVLKEENQVPTISLVRGPYNWGEWYGSVSFHENTGTDTASRFVGEEIDSFYSFGTKLRSLDGTYLTFGKLDTYRSYYEKFETVHRTYPQVADWNNDGEYDLVVGTDSGDIQLFINENGKFRLEKSVYAGETDLGTQLAIGLETEKNIEDGLFLVGNKAGDIYKLTEYRKAQNAFTEASLLMDDKGLPIEADAMAAPAAGDLTNDGRADLVVGNQSGSLGIYLWTEDGYKREKTISESIGRNLAPGIGDYNSDGQNDILVGNEDGEIHIFINNGKSDFIYQGVVETQRKNIYGEKTIYTGKNVVPLIVDFNKDGIKDILTGELSFSLAYDISSEQFQYREELDETIDYLQGNHIPILPHLYSHSYKDEGLEKKEYTKHKEVFNELGIPWEYVGTDQHTWRVNFDNPSQTFNNQLDENIYYNFGFRTPNNPGDPGFVLNHLWPNLWMYKNGNDGSMAMSTPSPMITMFPGVHRELALYDMPIIFFEHIENKINDGEIAPHLRDMINEINYIRDNHNYVFLTQDQMAQSFINNIETNYQISIQSDKIVLNRDTSGIPEELTGLYKGTNGVKIVFSKNASEFYSEELIQYVSDNQLFIGFLTDTVELSKSKNDAQLFNIISSNSPLIVKGEAIKINNYGMKQVVVASDKPLTIQGDELDVKRKNKNTKQYTYEITHWGDPVDITISEDDK